LFPDGDGDSSLSYAAYHTMNDPLGGQDAISALVEAGFLVRTRADTDGEEARALDYTRLQAALSSGAQFISTDFPRPASDEAYGVTMPDGTPSRCNVVTAPESCFSLAIEDPDKLR
jgi:hypothetical protein